MAKVYPWSQDPDRWLMGLAAGLSVLVLIALVVVLVLTGGDSDAVDPIVQDPVEDPETEQGPIAPDPTPAATEDRGDTGADPADADAQQVSFTARESGTTEPFEVTDGLLLLRVVHNGDGPFEVSLVPEGGQGIPVLLGSGTYRAVRAAGMPSGTYRLHVESAGPWAVGVEQPVFESGLAIPLSVEGDGEAVSDPLELDSDGPLDVQVSTEHGEALFVRVLDGEGRLLAEQELADGHHVIDGLPEGVVILDVRGEGIWRLHLREA